MNRTLTAEQVAPYCDAQRRSSLCVEVDGWTARHDKCKTFRITSDYRSAPCECPCHTPPSATPVLDNLRARELEILGDIEVFCSRNAVVSAIKLGFTRSTLSGLYALDSLGNAYATNRQTQTDELARLADEWADQRTDYPTEAQLNDWNIHNDHADDYTYEGFQSECGPQA